MVIIGLARVRAEQLAINTLLETFSKLGFANRGLVSFRKCQMRALSQVSQICIYILEFHKFLQMWYRKFSQVLEWLRK